METSSIEIKTGNDLPLEQLVELYDAVGWLAYTSDEQRPKLQQAIRNSTHVATAWSGDRLVGLARCVSDDVSICYLQDVLIHPDYQRLGMGRRLLLNCLARFEHVRMKVLVTDDEEPQKKFYESLGYINTQNLTGFKLNVFVQMAGMQLE